MPDAQDSTNPLGFPRRLRADAKSYFLPVGNAQGARNHEPAGVEVDYAGGAAAPNSAWMWFLVAEP